MSKIIKTTIEQDNIDELPTSFFTTGKRGLNGLAELIGEKAAAPLRRGRPKAIAPKAQVTLRLDADVVKALRAIGKGWQTKANTLLRNAVTKSGLL